MATTNSAAITQPIAIPAFAPALSAVGLLVAVGCDDDAALVCDVEEEDDVVDALANSVALPVLVCEELEDVAVLVELVTVSLLREIIEPTDEIDPMPVTSGREGTGVLSCLTMESTSGEGASTSKLLGFWQSKESAVLVQQSQWLLVLS